MTLGETEEWGMKDGLDSAGGMKGHVSEIERSQDEPKSGKEYTGGDTEMEEGRGERTFENELGFDNNINERGSEGGSYVKGDMERWEEMSKMGRPRQKEGLQENQRGNGLKAGTNEEGGKWKVSGSRKREGKRKGSEEKVAIDSNPAMKFVLERKGREQVENKIKLKSKITLELFYRFEAKTFNPKKKIEELMERLRKEDERIEFSIGDEEEELHKGETMGEAEFHRRFKIEHYRKRMSVTAKVTIKTFKTLNGLKHDNGGRLVNWLKRQKIMMEINRWEAEPYTNIGYIIMRHPTMTWKQDLKEEMRRHLTEQKKQSGGRDQIPEFILYHDRKSFGAGAARVHATVLYVQCKEEDAGLLKDLLGRGKSQRKMAFVPAGYHLSTSPRRLIEVLSGHNRYVNSRRPVPLIGISETQMDREVTIRNEKKTVRSHIKERLRVDYIERTNRTEDLGKWIVITEQEKYVETKRKIDEVLEDLVKVLEEESEMMKVGYPRRTDKSLAEGRYKEYVRSLEDIVPHKREEQVIPEIQVKNVARKSSEGDSEERQETRKKSYTRAVVENGGTGSQMLERQDLAGDVVGNRGSEGKCRMRKESDKTKDRDEMDEIRKRNELIIVKQEESRKRMEAVTRGMKESREQYEVIREIVKQQSEMIKSWAGGQIERDEAVEDLRKEQRGSKRMIQEIQIQVQTMYNWICKQEGKDERDKTPVKDGNSKARTEYEETVKNQQNIRTVTPGKVENKI